MVRFRPCSKLIHRLMLNVFRRITTTYHSLAKGVWFKYSTVINLGQRQRCLTYTMFTQTAQQRNQTVNLNWATECLVSRRHSNLLNSAPKWIGQNARTSPIFVIATKIVLPKSMKSRSSGSEQNPTFPLELSSQKV